MLAGAGAVCRVAFTFDVIGAPDIDQNPAPGLQTAQVVDNTQLAGRRAHGVGPRLQRGTTILRARPAIATAASPSVTLGGQVTDTAVVSGRVNPVAGATVDFLLYGPDDATCAGAPDVPVTGAAGGRERGRDSEPFTPAAPGTYRWRAFYSGDANNEPVSGACDDANENVDGHAAGAARRGSR